MPGGSLEIKETEALPDCTTVASLYLLGAGLVHELRAPDVDPPRSLERDHGSGG